MPRVLSSTATAALYAQETGEAIFYLLTVTHASLSTPLRFVNNHLDVVSNGDTYLRCAFEIALPDDREDQLPRVQLRIDNVDRAITAAIRSLDPRLDPPHISLQAVLASTPNTVEAGPFDFTLRDVSYDALVVTGELRFEDVLNEAFPEGTFSPVLFPGLFST